MRTRVLLAPDLAEALGVAGLDDAEAIFRLGGETRHASVVTTVDVPLPGTEGRFHLKRYLYPGWGKSRHLIGRGTLWGTPPELNEFVALTRLRELGVPAVRPVAAAATWEGLRLAGHALLTEDVPGALDLRMRLADPTDPVASDSGVRRRVLDLVASHLSRMHAGAFVHRDVHARNVLVRLEPEPAIWFLDCRRGGSPTGRRPALHDLASLELDLEGRVSAADRLRMLRTYLPPGAGAPATCRAIRRERNRLAHRLQRKGRPLRR